jgi:hypothetical protein
MKDKLISFSTAKLAKEKGFDLQSNSFNYVYAPTQSLIQKWLREVHKINIEVTWMSDKWFVDNYDLSTPMPNKSICKTLFNERNGFNTYEKALEKGLEKALKLI